MSAVLHLTFPGGEVLALEVFSLERWTPMVVRRLGLLADAREASVGLDNGAAWSLRFNLGPLSRADSQIVRRNVGARVEALIDDPERPPADWPRTEGWVNAQLPDATVTAVAVRRLADDPALGSRYLLELTFRAPLPFGPAHPPGPDPVYPEPPTFLPPFPPPVAWPGSVTGVIGMLGVAEVNGELLQLSVNVIGELSEVSIMSLAVRSPGDIGTIGELSEVSIMSLAVRSPGDIGTIGELSEVSIMSLAVRSPGDIGTIGELGVDDVSPE